MLQIKLRFCLIKYRKFMNKNINLFHNRLEMFTLYVSIGSEI